MLLQISAIKKSVDTKKVKDCSLFISIYTTILSPGTVSHVKVTFRMIFILYLNFLELIIIIIVLGVNGPLVTIRTEYLWFKGVPHKLFYDSSNQDYLIILKNKQIKQTINNKLILTMIQKKITKHCRPASPFETIVTLV